MNNSLGKHIILELYGCSFELLDNHDLIVETFNTAIKEAKMTCLDFKSHKFEPQGVTAVALLSESHMSMHTYPELGYAAADVFTCGQEGDAEAAMNVLVKVFKPEKKTVLFIPRGIEIEGS